MSKRAAAVQASLLSLVLAACASPCPADLVVAWGYNGDGEQGNGSFVSAYAPHIVSVLPAGTDIVASGAEHGFAAVNGRLYAWGNNDFGQLGNNTVTASLTPRPVNGLDSGVTAVAGGVTHSLAVRSGVVYAWGSNFVGELGDGTTTEREVPVMVKGLPGNVVNVAGGNGHSLAMTGSGALYAWGNDYFGELGDGATASRTLPVAVSGLSGGVTAIAAGLEHSLAIKAGALLAWGDNAEGQLGDGTVTIRLIPTAVVGLTSGVTAIAAGGNHNLAVKDGQVYGWGSNASGELGLGDTSAYVPTPTLIPGLSDIVAVAAAYSSSYALGADGSLWVFGFNGNGELGLGDAVDRYTPAHVLPPDGYRYMSITAGYEFALATIAPVPEPGVGLLLLPAVTLLRRRR